MKAIYLRKTGLVLLAALTMTACSDVVDIPSYDPYSCNGAPVIEATLTCLTIYFYFL